MNFSFIVVLCAYTLTVIYNLILSINRLIYYFEKLFIIDNISLSSKYVSPRRLSIDL